jgi:hypothetical protein
MVDGERERERVGFGRRLGVSLRLGGVIGWFISVASSGLSLGLNTVSAKCGD